MKKLFTIIGIFCVIATALPLVPHPHWIFRIFDFPRLQVAVLSILSFSGVWYYYKPPHLKTAILVTVLAVSALYQVSEMIPYTPLAVQQVLTSNDVDTESTVSLLSANVYQENRNSEALLEAVGFADPDIVLLLETDDWWKNAVASLQEEYPYCVEAAKDNTYGMLMFSRYKLIGAQVEYLIKDDIPSIHAEVQLPSGKQVKLYALHPEPPSPTESASSIPRDGELMLCGKMARRDSLPVIVVGDLNDVAWSATTRLFQKASQLLDPRIGRGFYNTFNANYPVLRWPLDHVFHSDHFKLVRLDRMGDIGSDHFPIYAKLSLETDAVFEQDPPPADREDMEEVEEKIEQAGK